MKDVLESYFLPQPEDTVVEQSEEKCPKPYRLDYPAIS
jgi:hypothetical protein